MQLSKKNGFSIIEIIIVLVIIAILTIAIAPSFKLYLLKSNRTDAIKTIVAIQIAEEKYRLSNPSYSSDVASLSPTGTPNSISGYYTIAITNASATAYTLTLTATGSQASDTECANMQVAYSSGTAIKSPLSCWQ